MSFPEGAVEVRTVSAHEEAVPPDAQALTLEAVGRLPPQEVGLFVEGCLRGVRRDVPSCGRVEGLLQRAQEARMAAGEMLTKVRTEPTLTQARRTLHDVACDAHLQRCFAADRAEDTADSLRRIEAAYKAVVVRHEPAGLQITQTDLLTAELKKMQTHLSQRERRRGI